MIPASVLAAANLVPLLGVVFWGWDAFELLVLYWLETGIIAFWTILQVGLRPARTDIVGAETRRVLGGFGRAVFFSVHAGIFMAVHMMFLWNLFAGAWADRIHGPADFVRELIVGNGIWMPLALLFIVRGASTVSELSGLAGGRPEGRGVLHELYRRIITLHVTLIFGGFAANVLDGRFAPALLIALKTGIDLFYDPFRARSPGAGPVSKAGSPP